MKQKTPRKRRVSKRVSTRPTLVDVARFAQVSTATVSKVLNKAPSDINISDDTKNRVLEAVKSLRYEPNHLARSLKTQSTKVVGLIVSDIRDPYFGEIIHGVEEALLEAGYVNSLSSAISNNDLEGFHSDLFNQMRVDGILVAGLTSPTQKDIVLRLSQKGIPMVALSSDFPENELPQVSLDYATGIELVIGHLTKLGHTRIGYIAGPSSDSLNRMTIEAFEGAAAKLGLSPEDVLVVESGYSPEEGYHDMLRLLRMENPPTAVYCCQNAKAQGALKALWEKNISVPEGISLAALDANGTCEFQTPPITSIEPPRNAMGYQAAQLLLKKLKNPTDAVEPIILFQPRLHIRESTGPCPA